MCFWGAWPLSYEAWGKGKLLGSRTWPVTFDKVCAGHRQLWGAPVVGVTISPPPLWGGGPTFLIP